MSAVENCLNEVLSKFIKYNIEPSKSFNCFSDYYTYTIRCGYTGKVYKEYVRQSLYLGVYTDYVTFKKLYNEYMQEMYELGKKRKETGV